MNQIIWILVVFINISPFTYSLYSQDIDFRKTQINIPIQAVSTENILVFKGAITEDNLLSSSPILGKTIKKEDTIQFIPVVPFDWNQKYTVIHEDRIEYYMIPIPKDYESIFVKNIYPSASAVPKNILKWYIQFSRPVNVVNLYDHLKFVSTAGDTLPRAILPLVNTLISRDGTLVTIWITPGRQKRGLIPNKQLGPVFNENEKYHLLISKKIKDRNGVPMNIAVKHTFTTKNEDRISPSTDTWNIEIPTINTISNLIIHSNESFDYGSSKQAIKIISPNNIEIIGNWQLLEQETVLSFTPKKTWQKGRYQIVCNPLLEDLAGNNLDKLFDAYVDTIADKENKNHILHFTIK